MKKPTSKKTPRKPRPSLKLRKSRYNRVVEFPQTKGRTVEMVEFIADNDYHCVSIRFQDNTELSVVIDPALTVSADFSDWKTHDQRILKRWPALRCEVS